jgi:hypothetical protein
MALACRRRMCNDERMELIAVIFVAAAVFTFALMLYELWQRPPVIRWACVPLGLIFLTVAWVAQIVVTTGWHWYVK